MADETSNVPEISVTELRDRLDAGASVMVVDIRSRKDFEEWHIPGSLHIEKLGDPEDGPERNDVMRVLPEDEPVVTVCPSGNKSRTAAHRLRDWGRVAYSLDGGLRAWTLAWNTAELELPDDRGRVVQVRRTGKGCLSYVVGSGSEALVIDPALDPEVFEVEAEKRGWRIVGVVETHVHADHLSRARKLADSTGARLYLPEGVETAFQHRVLGDGDVITFGNVDLTVLSTPGHTPESASYRLGDAVVFTGDTLFLDGVGRPDLDADADGARRKARQLHQSLRRLASLPDGITVLPAHTASPVPFDGRLVGASLEDVRDRIPALAESAADFAHDVLARIPPTPANHQKIIPLNRRGEWPAEQDVVELESGANRCAAG
ncbi:MAG: MBL fold metallo-hydrolase [Gemmatimonadota bacterium]